MSFRIAAPIFLVAIQAATADYTIDLTLPSRTGGEAVASVPEEDPVTLRVPPRRRSDRPPMVPFEITGLLFDRSAYKLGEALEYEVLVRYTGSIPIDFPSSPNHSQFRRSHPGLRAAVVSLGFEDAVLKRQRIPPQTLYGSPQVQGSLLRVRTGETIRLRIPSKWILLPDDPPVPALGWTRSIALFCELSLYFTSEPYLPRRSGLSSEITLQK